jgi:acyl carrier protein
VDIAPRVLQVVGRRTGLPAPALRDELWLGDPAVGLDSVALLELVLECERAFGCRLSSHFLEQQPLTLGALVTALRQTLAGERVAESADAQSPSVAAR